MEDAVKAAALRRYDADGWRGFSFESIAREAAVGKPALYLRWSGREQLLADALTDMSFPRPRDLGSFEQELRHVAHELADWWLDGSGRIALRLSLESTYHPELAAVYDEVVRRPASAAARALTEQAIARGELAPDTDRYMVEELLAGSIMTRFGFTLRRAGGRREEIHAYVERLADAILRAFPPAAR